MPKAQFGYPWGIGLRRAIYAERCTVAMDDFIHGEPTSVAVVPEPGTYALKLGRLGAVLTPRRRRAARA